MEKIETIEQLDKVGLKLCEMLNISIDKASLVLPETMQQLINYTIIFNSSVCFLTFIILGLIVLAVLKIRKSFPAEIDDPFICAVGFFAGIASLIGLIVSGMELLKAIIAPNILIIEKLSQLLN